MPVNYNPDPSTAVHVEDVDSIKKRATTKAERRRALQHCLDNEWASSDIGLIERVETASKWGWAMHPYRA
jgi:hypothetical protein